MKSPSKNGLIDYNLSLELYGEKLRARLSISSGPIRVVDLLPVLYSITDVIVYAAAQNLKKQAKKITCQPGCSACCRQVIPISESEAIYLTELVAAMPAKKQAQVCTRFNETLAQLEQSGHLQQIRKINDLENVLPAHRLQLDNSRRRIPCPFLENESCTIYHHRPLICREYAVTSPPAHCFDQGLKKIDRLSLPLRLSPILYRFGDALGHDKIRWLPLARCLDWAKQNHNLHQKTLPGPRLLENFLSQFSQL